MVDVDGWWGWLMVDGWCWDDGWCVEAGGRQCDWESVWPVVLGWLSPAYIASIHQQQHQQHQQQQHQHNSQAGLDFTSKLPRYLTSKLQLLDLTAASSAGHCLPAPWAEPPPPPPSSCRSSLRRKLERKLRLSLSIHLCKTVLALAGRR